MRRDALVSEMLQMCALSARKGEAMRNKLYVGLLTVLIGGFLLRRQAIRWGATDEEVHKPLRGDAVVPHPQLETTHAVTINAPAMAVWPWLVQMGYDRAGRYLDARWWDWLVALRYSGERADQSTGVPGGRHNADWIVPEFERLTVGDTILDGPPGTAFFVVRELEPNRALVLSSHSHHYYMAPAWIRDHLRFGIRGALSSAYVLEEMGNDATRLILRTRIIAHPRIYRMLTEPLVLLGGALLTERMTLQGIKKRAERTVAQATKLSPGERR